VANGVVTAWPVEEIEDGEVLYRRVHRNWFFPNGTLNPGAFRDYEMSTDWQRYSSAEEARQRARKPNETAIVSLVVGEVRRIDGQRVQHAPVSDNRAHTNVIGDKSTKVRQRLVDTCKLELALPEGS
jgi:hypothetical protein